MRAKIKSWLLGNTARLLVGLIYSTMRVTVVIDPAVNTKQQALFAFWHGKQLLPIVELRKIYKMPISVLVSPSKDGDILTVWLQKIRYTVLRGSSRQKNVQGLREMIRQIKMGDSLGFGIDGPIGPIYKVKPGMTHMAQKFCLPIVPMGSAFEKKWVISKAWDKYEIPKPFSKAVFYLGKPIQLESHARLDEENLKLEQLIHDAGSKAQELLR